MKVIFNAQPLSWGFCGTKHYLNYLLPELVRQSADLKFTFITDRPIKTPIQPESTRTIRPVQHNLKQKLIWESAAFALGTMTMPADVVHVPFQAAMVWSRQPLVMTVHDTVIWEADATRTERFYFNVVRKATQNARFIITVSEYSKKKIVEIAQVPPERVVVTPIAASPDFASPAPESAVEAFKQSHDLTRPYLIYVGGNAVRKGIPNLVRAYYALRSEVREAFDLVIVADIGTALPHHIEIHQELAKPLSTGNIHIIKEVSQAELPAAYTGAAAFIFPSMYEGFGLSPLEAMGCGVPALVSNRTSMPEVAGDAAVLFDPASIEEMRDAITSVLESPELRASLRERGFKRVAHFNWATTAKLTLDTYQRAMTT